MYHKVTVDTIDVTAEQCTNTDGAKCKYALVAHGNIMCNYFHHFLCEEGYPAVRSEQCKLTFAETPERYDYATTVSVEHEPAEPIIPEGAHAYALAQALKHPSTQTLEQPNAGAPDRYDSCALGILYRRADGMGLF